MSLGFCVVQLDVSVVNVAVKSIGASIGGGVSALQLVVSALHGHVRGVHPDRRRAR